MIHSIVAMFYSVKLSGLGPWCRVFRLALEESPGTDRLHELPLPGADRDRNLNDATAPIGRAISHPDKLLTARICCSPTTSTLLLQYR